MQIKIPDKYKDSLSSATMLAGFKWGRKGTPSAALIAIASGTHQLIPTNGSPTGNHWIEVAMKLIEAKQSIVIEYESSYETSEVIHAQYAEIIRHNLQYNLEVWSPQIGTDANLPYNRCLQFNRILNIQAATDKWRGYLDTLEVEFCLYDNLANTYISKPTDTFDEKSDQKRVIRRSISNAYYFVRELMLYGEDCQIVYPQPIANLLVDRLKLTLDRYQN